VVKAGDGLYLYLNGKQAGYTPVKRTFRQAKDTELQVSQDSRTRAASVLTEFLGLGYHAREATLSSKD